MAHTHQQTEWLQYVAEFKEHSAWQMLSAASRQFIERFESNLRDRYCPKSRANVVTPFRLAVNATLAERGIKVDQTPASVEIGIDLERLSDISFTFQDDRWVIEIKTGLEFNTLGAAVLEALAFRAKTAATRLVLLSLYAKWRSGNLLEVLRTCNLQGTFDEIHILTSNSESGDVWYVNWAGNLNKFVAALPETMRG